MYWSYRDEISAYDGVLYKSHQVIVPTSLRPEMLKKIHKVHQDPDSSIQRAREALFWPGMRAAIRESCLACGICAQYQAERPVEPMLSHDVPSRPWSKISVVLFQLDGKHYLVMVDHYSDYFELDSLRSTTASAVIKVMKRNLPVVASRTSASATMGRNLIATSTRDSPGITVSTLSSHLHTTAAVMGNRNPL